MLFFYIWFLELLWENWCKLFEMFLKKIPFYQENKGQALIRLEYSLTNSTNLNEKYKFGKHDEKKLLSLLVVFFFSQKNTKSATVKFWEDPGTR